MAESFKSGLIIGVTGYLISFLTNYFMISIPETLMTNAIEMYNRL